MFSYHTRNLSRFALSLCSASSKNSHSNLSQVILNVARPTPAITTSGLHTSKSCFGLEEFFDKKDNWSKDEVRVGRSWKKEELRIKSNEDLHKLWFVLLKEKNMLLTMEHACKEEFQLFPNPERIDKVEEGMQNLEDVVRERDRAYWLLETGQTGERPKGEVLDAFGRNCTRRYAQYTIPEHENPRIVMSPSLQFPWRTQFNRLLREQGIKRKQKARNRQRNYIARLCQNIPDIDLEALQQKYPEANVQQIKGLKRSRGNHNKNWN